MDWEFYKNSDAKNLWLHLLLMASHKGYYDNYGNKLNPGQLSTGIYQLAAQTGLSPKQVRLWLGKLKSGNQIGKQSNNKCSIITIVNWEQYQVEGKQVGKPRASKGQHYKNDKNEKKRIYMSSLEKIYKEGYPKRLNTGRQKGLDLISSQILSEDDLKSFGVAVKNYSDYCKRGKIEKPFIKMFQTFCNPKNWTEWIKIDEKDELRSEEEKYGFR